jgi:CHAT domain-containing protein
MIRSIFAASASPRGARHPLGWLLLASLLLPLAGQAGTPAAREMPWPPAAGKTPIAPGEVHSWTFDMAAGDFLDVVVEQDGIDVVVELFDGPTRILEADSPECGRLLQWCWEEETAWVAERPGSYRLVVYPLDDRATPGSYAIRVDGPRPARTRDSLRVEATREMWEEASEFSKRGREAMRLDHLEKALRLWCELGDRRREAEVRYQMGETAVALGRLEEASAHFHRSLDLWDQLGLPEYRVLALHRTAVNDQALLREEHARVHMEDAVRIAQRQGNRPLLQQTLYEAGRFFEREPRVAVQYMEAAHQLAIELKAPRKELLAAYRLGYSYDDLGEKQEALGYYEKALDLARQQNEAGIEANTLNGLGLVYASLGKTETAIGLYQSSLAISRSRKDAEKETAALNNLALIYEKLDPAHARELYQRTLDLGRETSNRDAQAAALSNLALLEARIGDPARALELGDEAMALGVKRFEVPSLQAKGVAWRKLPNLESSRRDLQRALELSRQRQDRPRESLVILELARTLRKQGDPRGALSLLESGVDIVESLRTKVEEEDLRATFLASRQDIYGLAIDTLMALDQEEPDCGYDAEALLFSERARARSLLDILAEAGADVSEGANPELLERKRQLSADIEALEKRRLTLLEAGSSLREADERLGAVLDEYRRIESNLRASSPRYAALTQPEPLSVTRIQSDILDGRALLLEYALGEERSFLWAVAPDKVRSFELPPRSEIENAARRYYEALSVHPETPGGKAAQARLQAAADVLSRMLLQPVAGMLSGQPLLVVSDGALQYVPFGALPDPSSLDRAERVPLIAGHEVVSLPSASALAVLRRELAGRPAPSKILAVLADPVFQRTDRRPPVEPRETRIAQGNRAGDLDPHKLRRLRWSAAEAKGIAGLVPRGKLFMALGFDATRATATSGQLADYRMIHFATHGLIDSRHPELSSLVLSLVDRKGRPLNGFLRLRDIYNLDLNADLVVLSACQTALGQEIRGEGLVGLTRGFMYAGAARVMSSLWSVDDRATSELMKRFYRHMISNGLSPAEALRRAQIDMSRLPGWKSPYYWAAFSLQGEWR